MRKLGTWAVEIIVILLTILNLIHVFEKPAQVANGVSSMRNEFLLDAYKAGETVDGKVLQQAYDTTYLVALLIALLVYAILGSVVLRFRPKEPAVQSFHYLMWSTAALIGLSWTIRDGTWLDVVLRGGSVAAHAAFCAALVGFSTSFPQRRVSKFIPTTFNIVALATTIAGFLSMIPIIADAAPSDRYISIHLAIHQFSQFYFTISATVASTYFFVDTFRTTKNVTAQRQLLWVFLGLGLSMATYIVLWVVPRNIIDRPLIPEYSLLLIACIAPITFMIAILKYRLLDISSFLQRGFVTAIIGSIVFTLLYSVHQFVVTLVGSTNTTINVLISVVVLIAIGRYYEPLRSVVQSWVDASIFKVKYDYRSVVRSLGSEFRSHLSVSDVYIHVLERIQSTLEPERSSFMLFNADSDMLRCVAEHNFQQLHQRSVQFDSINVRVTLRLPIILESDVESGVECEFADPLVFDRWHIACVQPVIGGKDDLIGFIVLGKKTNERQFTIEDVDLLRLIAAQAGLAIERLRFHEALLISTAESKHLQELNDMKTAFVSAVSHDLKVPLTAIKLMAELSIPSQTDIDKKRLQVIVGEADRLSGLIDNILTFSRMERGALIPRAEPIELNDLVSQTIQSLRYQSESLGFIISIVESQQPIVINADSIHMLIVLQNLISNAMKYSGTSKELEVVSSSQGGLGIVEIIDHGIGIHQDELEHIFLPFERASSVVESSVVPGTGLGLAIVSDLVRRNHGSVSVESILGEGSTFRISFPIAEEYS